MTNEACGVVSNKITSEIGKIATGRIKNFQKFLKNLYIPTQTNNFVGTECGSGNLLRNDRNRTGLI